MKVVYTSDAWHIPRYPTRKHCITSIYYTMLYYTIIYYTIQYNTILYQPRGVHCWECVSYARLRIGVVSQPFCVDQSNPSGFNVSLCLIRKTAASSFPTRETWESKNKYGGGRFFADNIHFQFNQ